MRTAITIYRAGGYLAGDYLAHYCPIYLLG